MPIKGTSPAPCRFATGRAVGLRPGSAGADLPAFRVVDLPLRRNESLNGHQRRHRVLVAGLDRGVAGAAGTDAWCDAATARVSGTVRAVGRPSYNIQMMRPREVFVLRHAPFVPLGSIEGHLVAAGVPFRQIDLFAAVPERLPLARAAGLIVLGGPMSAYQTDEYPYLLTVLDWIREAVRIELPLLGVCLGAQLTALALGGRVYPNGRKEIGWCDLSVFPAAERDLLLAGSAATETVLQWHGDTFELPPRVTHLAASTLCPNQVFRAGRRAWAVQFHLEMTPALLDAWFTEPVFAADVARLDYVDAESIRNEAPRRFPAMERFSRRILDRFVALCGEA